MTANAIIDVEYEQPACPTRHAWARVPVEPGPKQRAELKERIRRLLKERNHNWLPKLLAMPEKNQFLVVGALHLYGPDGVLNLLRQQGYEVQVVTDAHE